MRSAYISGWEYLDKIVQLSFAMPEPPAFKMQRLARSCLQGDAAKPKNVKSMLKRYVLSSHSKTLDSAVNEIRS